MLFFSLPISLHCHFVLVHSQMEPLEGQSHRLNRELYLQSLFGLHVHSCTLWLRPRNPPPRIWAQIRGRNGSATTTSLSDPLATTKQIRVDEACAGIFKQSMGARNRFGIGLSYRPDRLHRLAELIPWSRFLGSV
jgi:hypothetical protein